ncbi:MAG: arginine--tRNA ligase [candidate division Zixibacteria bacterium]|nr:arginine--tRNA ligase [candidate division Zixibacteria bacterium]
MNDIFRKNAAEALTEAIAKAYPDKIEDICLAVKTNTQELADFIYNKLESPKDAKNGDYAFPTFILAKPLRNKPPEIAGNILEHLDKTVFTQTGPYLNMKISTQDAAEEVLSNIFSRQNNFGNEILDESKTIVIDFSSPNIAKPFGIGHLRSTAIGNSLYRLFEKLGYNVVGINHLGDWGTQFGKMIAAYKKWGDDEKLKVAPIDHLFDLYVKFHKEAETDQTLESEGREWFKKLEEGNQEAAELWQIFKDYSLQEFQRVYDLLGVHFDYYTGESFYNDKMDGVIERLQKAGLTKESEGALIVDLEEQGMNPCLLKKTDGATLYATRDLAGILYRHGAYKFDKALYVVGMDQQEHFKQVFKVIELLGEDFAKDLIHVSFGFIRFKDQAMSTRKGNIVFLNDVIKTAIEKVTNIIKEKNPNLPDLEKTAQQVAVGAIVFADLSVSKHKDVNFDWDEVLNFEGATGPYLQYTHARLSSLVHKYGLDISGDANFSFYNSPEEKALIMQLHKFGQTIRLAAGKYEPNIIAAYLLELAAVFNRFYQRKDNDGKLVKIISEDNPEETKARMLLVASVRIVMKEGLRLMGIEAPEEM